MANGERFWCPIHGDVTDPAVASVSGGLGAEMVRFDLDGEEDLFCLRCWRDWMRENISRLERKRAPHANRQ